MKANFPNLYSKGVHACICVCVCVCMICISMFLYRPVCVIIKFIFKVYFTFILRSIETLFNFFLNNLHLLRNSTNVY